MSTRCATTIIQRFKFNSLGSNRVMWKREREEVEFGGDGQSQWDDETLARWLQ